jgi:hypothetical protein
LIYFCRSLLAQEDPEGGIRSRNLNLGIFTAPTGQQALVLSHAWLAVILKQKLPLLLLVCSMS